MQHGIVSFRQTADEAVRIGQLGRLHHLFVGGVQLSVTYVLHHRSREQMRVLQHDAQRTPQIRLLDLGHIYGVISYFPILNIIKSVDQVGDGGLARAGSSHKGDLLTRLRV